MLCAFLIVCIHAPFAGVFGEYFTVLTRIAVPIFFMISGYFWNSNSSKKQILKLLKLLLIGNAIYATYGVIKAITSNSVNSYVESVVSMESILSFVFLNDSPFAPHLWYLGAVIYVLIVFSIAERTGGIRIVLIAAPFLLLGDLLFGKYSLLVFHREFSPVIVRNWIFVGIPYFSLGYLLHINKGIVRRYLTLKRTIIGIAMFAITSLLEKYVLVLCEMNAARDHYLSTTLLAVAVFLLFLLYVNNRKTIVAKIGRKDTTWVYILHYLLISVLFHITSRMGATKIYIAIRPIVVFGVTVLFVQIINWAFGKRIGKTDFS